ncbi:MAG: M23 family metallopeptidase, partial [Chloroflexi bacterium]|nr:M23 family metallopeptidase [Chloroflexota bacterium]
MRRLVRRGRPKGWGAFAAILTLLLTASTLGLGSTPAHAQGGVFPLPTEAGSVWEIVAGYNTATHSVADQNDPHAIDLVRVDGGSTTGSVVRSPIAGTISYVDYSDCLTIDNGAGLAVLLCHIFPDSRLYRGLPVQLGEYLGTVAPAGYANNNGLPHIHLAVHHTTGGGRLQGSIPLTGAWAVEGIDLPQTGEDNAHQG